MPRWILLGAALLPFCLALADAQEPDYADDLRFVEALRARGDNRLAADYLGRLAKTAPPPLLRELPLEFAKTELREAADEPETARRLDLYRQARENFQKFITANPGHPRVAEASHDIARVLNLLGKTELNRAQLTDDAKAKQEYSTQARATLVQASAQLQAAGKVLAERLAKLPDPAGITEAKEKKQAEAVYARAQAELKQTELDVALNLYDQAATYSDPGDLVAAGLLGKARERLDPLVSGPVNQPITWKARAWLGRILMETESVEKGRAQFQRVLEGANVPAAAEGIRLARYFRLVAIFEHPTDADRKKGPNAIIIEAARRWRNDYPRFRSSPEGSGLSFLLARALLREADNNKRLTGAQATALRTEARGLLREVESSENEFTERARRLKIQTMARLGLFKVAVAGLKSFEDCYVRAQFEAMQLAEESRAGAAEEKLKVRRDAILAALRRGLAMPEVKKIRRGMELNNARAMLAYWALNASHLDEAIRVGEAFARDDPRSGQAEMSAVYALQAYTQLIAQKQAKFDETAAADRAAMYALAAYMEERWPRGLAGDMARHSVGLQLLREENFPEAIKKLSLIGPSYGSFTLVCYQIADAALKAERGSIEPIIGDRPGDYRKRALAALEAMPTSALGPDPQTNYFHVAGKAILGRELFKYRRFAQMDAIAGGLLDRLDKLTLHENVPTNQKARDQLRYELIDVRLFARYGLADAAFQAGDHAGAAKLLDPLVDAVARGAKSPEKANLQKNQQLSAAILSIALKANVQLGRIERTDLVLDVMDRVTGEGEGGTTNILKLLAFLIRGQVEELRKKGDTAELARAVEGYSKILQNRLKKQAKFGPDFLRVLADCYSSMGKHELAAAELARIPDPKAKPGSDEEKGYRAVQILQARELRLSKTTDNRKQARAVMDAVMGSAAKPGWGRKNLDALVEDGLLMEAEERWADGFRVWSMLTSNLARHAPKGGTIKERYLECYYHMVLSYLRRELARPEQAARDKGVRAAAQQIVNLERAWEEFGSDASRRRFTELLASEPLLREQYEALKKK